MNKQELVSTLHDAKNAHTKWADNALALIEGTILDQALVPVIATECKFGKWYYAQGQALKRITYFKELEGLHNELHKTYMDIFVILFGEKKQQASMLSGSILGKLFGQSHNRSDDDKLLAREKYQILDRQSKQMIKKLDQLEKLVTAMSSDQLDSFLNIA